MTLGEGLEEIREKTFKECTSLRHIVIPPAVKVIDDSAFNNCSNLTSVKNCDEIEEFVSCEAMRGWWNLGVHKRSLASYSSLVRCSIPERCLGLVSSWKVNIHETLRSIPAISAVASDVYSDDSKLTVYENLFNEAPMLFYEQFGLDYGIDLNILSLL